MKGITDSIFLIVIAIVVSFGCKNVNGHDSPALTTDNARRSPGGDFGQAALAKWRGLYLNTDIKEMTSYDSILQRVGWCKLLITQDEIIFESDKRMETDFPTEMPGGVYVTYRCNYQISGDTLKLFNKREGDNSAPERIVKPSSGPLLVLFESDGKYYGISDEIALFENMANAARLKSGPPYLFRKFYTDGNGKYKE